MKQNIFLLISFMALSFSCTNAKNDKFNTIEMSVINTTPLNGLQSITTTEFIVFWNKFSEAFLQNDTLLLSDLINNYIRVTGEFSTEIAEIATINFENDTIISKRKFIQKFRQSLNPVYLRLLKQYRIQENFANREYRCNESTNKYDYFVKTNKEYNKAFGFTMAYSMVSKLSGEPVIPQIILIFNKIDNEIKLKGIHFLVSVIYVNYNEL